MKKPLAFATLLLCSSAQAAITVDGNIDESQWQQAIVIDEFVTVEPYTQAAPAYQQKVFLLSLPEGLAIAFDIAQPAGIVRTKPQTQRDQIDSADRVNLIVDFDGKGQTAYNFTVSMANGIEDGIASRNNFRNDWDGDWQHAVQETDAGWSVEMLIPWSITAMAPVSGDTRTIGIYLDRVLKSQGERYGFPALRFSQSDFISTFKKIEVPAFSTSQSHVYPYVSVLHDAISGDNKTRAGLDVFYRPSSTFQLIGALNPDFGQGESDDLVIDFSAIEVFFSDKRPFFTENNDDFTLSLPDDGQLIYTRRVGGNRDDGKGISDIDAAVKLRGATDSGSLSYMGAQEADYGDDIGRRFQVFRPKMQIGDNQLGYSLLLTDRPFLQREAQVQAFDMTGILSENVHLHAQIMESQIDVAGARDRDVGAWFAFDMNPSVSTQHTFEVVNYGEQLMLSDLGYVTRTNLQQVAWQTRYVQTGFASDSSLQEVEWEGKIKPRRNQQGDDIGDKARLSTRLRNRSGDYAELEAIYQQAGVDDLISRGNGNWNAPSRSIISIFAHTARRHDSSWKTSYYRDLEGISELYNQFWLDYTHYFGDDLSLEAEIEVRDSPDWLIWQQDAQFIRYQRMQYNTGLAVNWFAHDKHEIRFKSQWLAIVAKRGENYDLLNGTMVNRNVAADDLTINTFGLQLRYRYKVGSLSDLFVVYSRGGFTEEASAEESPTSLYSDALSLRDVDQFLVKLRLQF